jgi:hypothetical protein
LALDEAASRPEPAQRSSGNETNSAAGTALRWFRSTVFVIIFKFFYSLRIL